VFDSENYLEFFQNRKNYLEKMIFDFLRSN
jgi:hypothetical protein